MTRAWVIAGGGTGGHFFSGVAIAEAVLERFPGDRVTFVGTRHGIEARWSERHRHDVRTIDVTGIKGRSAAARAAAVARLPRALWQSLAILRDVAPSMVIGVGGYASGPVLVAARMRGTPTAVMEQNSVPGFTNRLLSRVVDQVFLGFPDAASRFPAGDPRFVGNPIRLDMVRRLTATDPAADGADGDGRFHLLVFGGSQGAHSINLAMVEAVASWDRDLRERLSLVHQTGAADLDAVRSGYAEAGFEADVRPFIDDMAAAYRRADLVVCRAGALTVAELTICRRPAVLIPFPHAIDNHQEINARTLSDRGAARLLLDRDLEGGGLGRVIAELVSDDEARRRMARAAGELGRPGAGGDVVERCLELMDGRKA